MGKLNVLQTSLSSSICQILSPNSIIIYEKLINLHRSNNDKTDPWETYENSDLTTIHSLDIKERHQGITEIEKPH